MNNGQVLVAIDNHKIDFRSFRATEIIPSTNLRETLLLEIKELDTCWNDQREELGTLGRNVDVKFKTVSSKFSMLMNPKIQLVSTF